MAQISPHYFASLFKQSRGIAPHQYVTKCRVERAKYLLAKRELSVIQVSQLVGDLIISVANLLTQFFICEAQIAPDRETAL
ncbi:helix-turn-helix domain-containing protein [Nostoc sp.]|uniref:helix-turn-helix domain-containing protein n=1 Tax=Nostoc sp. TaxID=1180 RepID=UPI002FF46C9F